ncbi:hypothetical protein A3L04_10070 [Thermococcus chitonophagus]|uniref:DUF763 domain-containing protein n=2 Tax=Thermococcus chitonophagus TaxID=54262 RepID=A0A160VSJ8_9EURY|nr:DUF763 domain-containing protein [Thermococcus chitonophagus]ASJ17389.1 hypothetical protein A3L04_10070 [Thermococcus chitonophagus]CUX78027.1 hypothetical protein CHITON_1248 [Thermococcus chitonophagus]
MRSGIAELPLHTGHVPPWLASRMERLARIVLKILVDEYGTKGALERFADPVWFQAFNNLIGMDWDSSGSTTVTTGIVKEALNELDLGIKVAGGKGKASRKTPDELKVIAEKFDLPWEEYVKMSRLVAKVDSVALQTGYQLYHHTFFLDEEGNWAVVQQGMNPEEKLARRYHWFNAEELLNPHKGVAGVKRDFALNTVDIDSKEIQKTIIEIAQEGKKVAREVETIKAMKKGYMVFYKPRDVDVAGVIKRYESLGKIELNVKALEFARELAVEDYESFLLIRGLGPGTLRALALVAELIYDVKPSWRDPVTHPIDPFKFAYAVGGKDRVPFRIEKGIYDDLIEFLTRLEETKNREILKRVRRITERWKFPEEEKIPTF